VHPNESLAKHLKEFLDTGKDRHDILNESRRKGFVVASDGTDVVTNKGTEFIEKWTSGKPESTYQRKPEIKEQHDARPFQERPRQGYAQNAQGRSRSFEPDGRRFAGNHR
jgi:hypothetical protein